MAKKTETLNTESVLETTGVPDVVPVNYETLLEAAKRAPDVNVTEIDPCQTVTIEAHGRAVEAFLVVKE